MKLTQNEIAQMYSVSSAAVSGWGLQCEKQGRKNIVDTDLPENAQILAKKGNRHIGGTATATNTSAFVGENQNNNDIQYPQVQENLEYRQPPATITNYSSDIEIKKLQLEAEKIKLQTESIRAAQVFENEKRKFELKKIDFETKKIEKEAAALDGKYILDDVVQKLLESATYQIIDLEKRITSVLQTESDKNKAVAEIQKQFKNTLDDIRLSWEKVTKI